MYPPPPSPSNAQNRHAQAEARREIGPGARTAAAPAARTALTTPTAGAAVLATSARPGGNDSAVATRHPIGGFPQAPLGVPGIDVAVRDRTGVLLVAGPPPGGAAAAVAAMSTGATREGSVEATAAAAACLPGEERPCKAHLTLILTLMLNIPMLIP